MSLWAANRLDQPQGNVGHCLDWWLVWRGRPRRHTDLHAGFDRRSPIATAARSTSRARSVPATIPTRCGTSSRKPASCTSPACSPRTRWPRSPPTWTRPSRTYTRRRRPLVVGAHRRRATRASCACRASTASPTRWHALLDDDAVPRRSRRFPGAGHEFGRKRASNRIEALFKPIGVTEGHLRHPVAQGLRHRPALVRMLRPHGRDLGDRRRRRVGPAARASPGSHRALVWSGIRQPDLDLPDVPLPDARPATSRLHLSCTMHMAQPPVERERRVMYSGFSLPPRDDADAAAIAPRRAPGCGAVRETAPLTVLDKHFKS